MGRHGNREVRLQKMKPRELPESPAVRTHHAATAIVFRVSPCSGNLKRRCRGRKQQDGRLFSSRHTAQGVPAGPQERPQLASSDVGRQDTLSGRSECQGPRATGTGPALSAQPAPACPAPPGKRLSTSHCGPVWTSPSLCGSAESTGREPRQRPRGLGGS